MDLRMKRFNIIKVHWKIQLLEGVHKQQIYRGNCQKGGIEQLVDLSGGLAKKGRVDTPMNTMPRFLSWPTRQRKITNFLQAALFWKCFLPQQRGVVWELRKNTTKTMSAPLHNMLKPRHPNTNATQQPK